ncbi:uncharacterized protein MICPUCDRAFT_12229 [Micromonas pusilla CCMP1545]|uniref:Probable DNA helicase MCM8 n=1 Tax=Micromonas pusilla (strain CCMP1545) TaxID=564608 RepID=C1MHK8_MICPC|nr:uncharacterized protein MICPUCDRAFT_12229 [Micromonas pusilla CCMP1545]EEH60762.1 predicted protein [Micromonas pusilla CCMP1545]|eukprot:XP_003055510.1 predicted protein [Micromonas pusilla CCMP1545]
MAPGRSGGGGRFGGRFGRGGGRGRAPSRAPQEEPPPEAPSNVPPSWNNYFPEVRFAPDDRRAELVGTLARFFSSDVGFELVKPVRIHAERELFLELDYEALKARADIPDLFAALELAPAEAMPCVRAAVHEVIHNSPIGRKELPHLQVSPAAAKVITRPPRVDVHLYNHPEVQIKFSELKSKTIGKLVSIRGTVTRVARVMPFAKSLTFTCDKCDASQVVHLVDGKYAEPESCVGQGCRGRKFTANRESVKLVDWQKIRIQELSRDVPAEDIGRIPRFADVEVEGTLCDACRGGDIVTIVGIADILNVEAKGSALERERAAKQYNVYVKGISIRKRDSDAGGAPPLSAAAAEAFARDVVDNTTFSPADLEFIVRFTEECAGEQFKQLIHSLCPTIYGHEVVKAGLLLALFGGVRKTFDEEGTLPMRGSIHCLVVGDPGLGKSQMLKAVSNVANRGLYVSGRSASAAGLTATVVKDSENGGSTYEAGALIMCDGGVCCVDEFDKMPNEHQALLEVLEQQTVSLAKAGITVNLPARTSVVAAANPVGGVYNRSKSIMNNLKMNPALLSRFDLLFLIVDDPDEELDEYRTRHVLATHNPEGEEATLRLQHAQQKLLAHHAHYITYANVHCFPRLTPEAGTILQAFYLELRAADTVGEDYPPITPRQLEALIRLAEARAKVELRETVTEDDARDAVEIMRETMRDVLEGGGLAGKRGFSGKGNKNVKAKMFVEAMNRRAIEKDSAYFTMGELYAIVDDLQLQIQDVDGFIEGLNMAGDILKSGRLYKSASS